MSNRDRDRDRDREFREARRRLKEQIAGMACGSGEGATASHGAAAVDCRAAGAALGRFLSLEAVAEHLGVCVRTVRRLMDSDGFPRPIKLGARSMIAADELFGYMARKLVDRDKLTSAERMLS